MTTGDTVATTLTAAAALLDLPPCCRAEQMRRDADRMWEDNPSLADTFELFAVRTLECHGLPFDRDHDIENCPRRTSAFGGGQEIGGV